MAFSQKLSLRAYSFSFKKWKGKNPEQTLPLNAKVIFNRLQDGEERTYEYTSAFDLIVDFIGANTDVDDKEVRQQLFNCSFNTMFAKISPKLKSMYLTMTCLSADSHVRTIPS